MEAKMNKEWSLNDLYKGYDDPAFLADKDTLAKTIQEGKILCDNLSHDDEVDTLVTLLTFLERQILLENKLIQYIALRQSTNTSDNETVALMEQVSRMISENSKTIAKINRYIATVKDLDTVICKHPLLEEYTYLLKQTKEDGKYLLSDEIEEILAKLNISSGKAWEDLQSYLTSVVDVTFDGKTMTLPEIRNMAYDSNPSIRKQAYEAELKAYEKIDDAVAFSLNNIKAQVNTICELRGYDSPLDMTLYHSHMKHETLDALMSAIKQYLPLFQSYLKRKAELLGYTNGLPWYELFAPLEGEDKKYSLEEAKVYLLNHFRPFADDMADMIARAFDEEWIDFFPHKGKVGGAFCSNLPYIKQSRVLTNFDGALGDIVTLAHELGHAYHGMMIEDHRILNTEYSMPVAETASTFNENIIMNAAIEAADEQLKLSLIENQLQDLTQIMCDIYSRFLFEKEVFNRRKNGFMFANELKEIMIQAQKEAYGDALDPNYLHPYMWVNKSHYYSADLSFYNFPYAFGGLLARGLVKKYQENKETFLPVYRNFLKATTVSSVEDAACIADIDLTSETFWISCLETCKTRIQEFLDLSSK